MLKPQHIKTALQPEGTGQKYLDYAVEGKPLVPKGTATAVSKALNSKRPLPALPGEFLGYERHYLRYVKLVDGKALPKNPDVSPRQIKKLRRSGGAL